MIVSVTCSETIVDFILWLNVLQCNVTDPTEFDVNAYLDVGHKKFNSAFRIPKVTKRESASIVFGSTGEATLRAYEMEEQPQPKLPPPPILPQQPSTSVSRKIEILHISKNLT